MPWSRLNKYSKSFCGAKLRQALLQVKAGDQIKPTLNRVLRIQFGSATHSIWRKSYHLCLRLGGERGGGEGGNESVPSSIPRAGLLTPQRLHRRHIITVEPPIHVVILSRFIMTLYPQ